MNGAGIAANHRIIERLILVFRMIPGLPAPFERLFDQAGFIVGSQIFFQDSLLNHAHDENGDNRFQ